jgi:glyoxalase family protein
MASAHAYAVTAGHFDALTDRIALEGLDFGGPSERFGQRVLTLRDPDGAAVELIESDRTGGTVLDGFHSATLWERDPAPTARVLTDIFGYAAAGEERDGGVTRLRFVAPGAERGNVIDIVRSDDKAIARPGAGTIHHIAFRAETDDIQMEWREKALSAGHQVTPQIDRQYFNAIYFREPGGVLFEIATDPPGFAADEPVETLGRDLKLPPQHEHLRARLERTLPSLKVTEPV